MWKNEKKTLKNISIIALIMGLVTSMQRMINNTEQSFINKYLKISLRIYVYICCYIFIYSQSEIKGTCQDRNLSLFMISLIFFSNGSVEF